MSNIFISSEGDAFLYNFKDSIYVNGRSINKTLTKFDFAPPEFFIHNQYGIKGDIYAFGHLIYEMTQRKKVPILTNGKRDFSSIVIM